MTLTLPHPDFDATLHLVRRLVEPRPWHRPERPPGRQTDRALRAEYRHWTSADEEPTPLMLAPLWQHGTERKHPTFPDDVLERGWASPDDRHRLSPEATERAVRLAAVVQHLVAVAEGGAGRETPGGSAVDNLGRAAQLADVGEVRFGRIVNAAPSARLDMLGRLMRQIGRAGVPYRVAAPRPAPADEPRAEPPPDRRSTRATLRDLRRDDLAALLAFLFTPDDKAAATRWTAGYYGVSTLTPTAAEAA